MENETTQLWDKIVEIIKEHVGEQTWETWLRPIKAQDFSNNTLTLAVPNQFFQNWIQDHYLELLLKTIRSTLQNNAINIEFVVSKQEPLVEEKPKKDEKANAKRWFFQKPAQPQENPDQLKVNARFNFDSFVIGPSNRFAHAACLAVAESPARSYNPLFIYGGVGLGKTHLMQAVGTEIIKKNSSLKVTYISSEKFTNELISAIQHRTTPKFREKYRNVDVLLIDDIQFIAGKESTQEEFFHTFNTLYDAHKQIVVSSDRHPKDIPTLEERLVSRFEWGLVTDVQPPDLETRIAILKKKMEQNKVSVPDDVVYFIADKIKLNIRELEGALIRVVAYASLTNSSVSLKQANAVLKDMISEDKKVSIDLIQKKVAAHFDLRILDLKAKRRNRAVVYPRQLAMYLSRSLTDFSLPEIGEYFGGRDHTTVMHALNKIRKELDKDQKLKGLLDTLIMDIKTG